MVIVRGDETSTAQTFNFGGPLSDSQAMEVGNDDKKCIFEAYELKAALTELKVSIGDAIIATTLFEEVA